LIADPFWPKKVMEGRFDEILACNSCNKCFRALRGRDWKPGDSVCQVNERAGREIDVPLSESDQNPSVHKEGLAGDIT
jgi:hypothetical protein